MISWWHTEIGEDEKTSLLQAFDNKRFSMGPVVADLEKHLSKMLDVPYVVVTNSGTSALMISLLALGVKPGDEVIMPALSWIATAQSAAILGAKVILVDVLPNTPILDSSKVKDKISDKTKVIIPVHLNGRECDLKILKEIAQDAGAYIIEDTCKAICSKSKDRYLGTIGDIGCFSMGMVSLLTVGYGGFVVTRNSELYEKICLIRDHGVVRNPEGYPYLGANFKISDLLASIGITQISCMKERINHTCKIHRRYEKGLSTLKKVEVLPIDIKSGKVPLYTEIISKKRDDIYEFLKLNNIGTAKYHHPMNKAKYLGNRGEFENAERLTQEGLYLPSGPSQPLDNVDRCIELLHKYEKESS